MLCSLRDMLLNRSNTHAASLVFTAERPPVMLVDEVELNPQYQSWGVSCRLTILPPL